MQTSLFLRDFTVLDFAYANAPQELLGESFYVSVALEGTTDSQGFILDFGVAKKILKQLVDQSLDHKLVVPQSLELPFEYLAPNCAIERIAGNFINKESLEAHLEAAARRFLPDNVKRVRFHLREDARFLTEACFRYTHGLRFHNGNCQRLFHGHRNAIEVWVDGKRQAQWEALLAREWDGVHFASTETVKNGDMPLGQRQPQNPTQIELAFSAPQGNFSCLLPSNKIVLLDCEPSIENIARLGWQRLHREGLEAHSVVAYEGLNKGASFTSR